MLQMLFKINLQERLPSFEVSRRDITSRAVNTYSSLATPKVGLAIIFVPRSIAHFGKFPGLVRLQLYAVSRPGFQDRVKASRIFNFKAIYS